MLDSTGPSIQRKIPCYVCQKTNLEYEQYTPEYGHDGNALNVGSCMGPHDTEILNNEGAKLFRLQVAGERGPLFIHAQEVNIGPSGESYHYGGAREPDFGDRIGQVVFVCRFCVKHHGDTLLTRIDKIATDGLNMAYLRFLNTGFLFGLFSLNATQLRRRYRRIPESDRRVLDYRLQEFVEDLHKVQLGANEHTKGILAKCQRIQRILIPRGKASTKKTAA